MLRTRKLDVDQLVSWRQRLLSSLNKLGERDTLKTAQDELNKMIDELSEQTLPIFMSCLFETCETQKQAARKEAIRIFANLATVHRDVLQPYLPKMVQCIAKRVKDNDSGTRDVCGETIGTLAKFITPPVKSSGDHPLEVYFKPLFLVLSEQNKNNQTGASTCISRVIENSVGYVTLNLSHLCNRLLKFLNHPNFLAQPALLGALSQLVQTAGEYLIPHVPTFLGTLLDNLSSGDFPTRKASAEVLGMLALRLGPAVIQFRDEILPVLDELRFDKVKPVREAAIAAVEAYKGLSSPGNPPLSSSSSINDDRPKTPSRRATTPVRDRGRSASYGALPVNTNKVVSHTIQFKAPPKFDLSFPSSSSSLPPAPARAQYQNLPNQIPDSDSSYDKDEEDEDDDYASTSTLPPHSSSHSSIHSLASANGMENGKHNGSYNNPQPQPLTLLKQGKQRNSLPQPLVPQQLNQQMNQQQSLTHNLQQMNLQNQTPLHSPHNQQNQGYPNQNPNQNTNQNYQNQNQNYQNQPNQFNQPNQQFPHNQQNQQNMYSNQQNIPYSNSNSSLNDPQQSQFQNQQNMQNQNLQNNNNQQQKGQNVYNFNQPYPPQFSADNSSWTQVAEQLAKLTETQIQFMNRVDNFMFETRRDLGNLTQRMADLEGVVEILYNSHQDRVKVLLEDVFDPLDTPNPPSHEPYDAAMGYLGIGHVKAAYEKVVKSGDGLQLARLMEKTGPVIDKLDQPVLVELFVRIGQFVKTKAFLDTIFPWLWQSISLSKLPLEPPQLTVLMNSLEDISVDPSKNGIEAAQILAQLKKLGLVWG